MLSEGRERVVRKGHMSSGVQAVVFLLVFAGYSVYSNESSHMSGVYVLFTYFICYVFFKNPNANVDNYTLLRAR